MLGNPAQTSTTDTIYKSQSHWGRALQRLVRNPKATIPITILLVLYICGIFAPILAPYNYSDQNLLETRQSPSLSHLLGTDWVGRDMLSRIMYGIRSNLILTAASLITSSLIIGIPLGLIAGYRGGRADSVINRIGELFAAFPDFLMVVLIAATVRPRAKELVRTFEDWSGWEGMIRSGIVDYLVIGFAMTAFNWVVMERWVRGQVLTLKGSEYVQAALATGASTWRLLIVHLLPNALPPIVVLMSMGMGALATTEILLSWLGIGIQPPVPSLGSLIGEVVRGGVNITIIRNHPHLLLGPGVVVVALIFSWNLLGDALNDALNPRTR